MDQRYKVTDAHMFYEFAQNTFDSICQLLDMDISKIK